MLPQHTLIVLMQDHPGVLHRTVSLLRRRAFNIASLAVGHSEIPGVSRMTLVVDAAESTQVVQQLDRLVEVLAVHDITHAPAVQRETMLAKVSAPSAQLDALVTLARDHGARVLDLGAAAVILELTDRPDRVDEFVALIRPYGVTELMRTGRLAMMRGTMPATPTLSYRAQADGAGEEDEAA